MDLYLMQLALETIDFRSFSNLWFWIVLAVLWSTASHRVVGVPFDMVRRAARGDGMALSDMHALADINARRLRFIADETGLIATGLGCFLVTVLALLALLYRIEFAQAILLLVLPTIAVAGLSLRAARRVPGLDAVDLGNLLVRTRRMIQGIGVVSIFVTSMWGMWVNLNASALGH